MKKLKKKPFRFTLGHLIRLGVFIFVIYSLINYFSQNQSNIKTQSEVLGDQVPTSDVLNKYSTDIYQKLPPDTQQKITNLPQSPIFIKIKDQSDLYLKQLDGFPTKQFNQLKIEIIKKVSQDLINNITTPSPTP